MLVKCPEYKFQRENTTADIYADTLRGRGIPRNVPEKLPALYVRVFFSCSATRRSSAPTSDVEAFLRAGPTRIFPS